MIYMLLFISVIILEHKWLFENMKFVLFFLLEKGVGIVPPIHLVYDFSRKIFVKLYSVNAYVVLDYKFE